MGARMKAIRIEVPFTMPPTTFPRTTAGVIKATVRWMSQNATFMSEAPPHGWPH